MSVMQVPPTEQVIITVILAYRPENQKGSRA